MDTATAAKNENRTLAAWEIVSVCVSFLLALWVVVPLSGGAGWVRGVPLSWALALMVLSQRARGESWRDVGWRTDNFVAAAKLLAVPTLGALALFLLSGWLWQSWHFERKNLLTWALWLPLWGLAQQFVLQGYVNRRAQILFGKDWRSVLLTACVFGLLHLPNPWLSLITFTGGLLWAWVYQKTPNLLALALSHAGASLVLACAWPPAMLKSLRVGINYFG